MSNIIKAYWQADADNVDIAMPITKIDRENRLVSGWATLDNPDKQGDIVLAEASRNAFERFRGNVRRQHDKHAPVGRMVDFKEEAYYDSETEKFYSGIVVTVYISKGAEDTWEMVLDGTLSGFSIMGPLHDAEPVIMNKEDGETVQYRIIKDYDLVELSLVDTPANHLANVFSIVKSEDGSQIIKGMVADVRASNVFWCETDGLAKTSTEESANCGICSREMVDIGWFEDSESTEKVDMVKELIDAHLIKKAASEGGADMTKKNDTTENVEETEDVEKADEVVENEQEQEDAVTEESNEEEETEEVEKAADVSETEEESDEVDVQKILADMQKTLVEAMQTENAGLVSKLDEAIASFTEKIDGLSSQHKELTEKFDALSSDVDGVQKRLDSVEDGFAIKKSGDLGGSSDELVKNKDTTWGGALLPQISHLENE